MKNKKLISTLVLLLVVSSIFTNCFAAYQITFTPKGDRYIYSNNPESVKTVGSGKFTIEQKIYKDIPNVAEFYHFNVASQTLTFGVAVKNTSHERQYVIVRKEAKLAGQYTLATSTDVTTKYGKSSLSRYVYIDPGKCAFITTLDSKAPYQVANAKVRFTSSSDMVVRVFFAPAGCKADQVFKYQRATSDQSKKTTAAFLKNIRYANINALSAPSFILSSYGRNDLNKHISHEYEIGTDALGSPTLFGNFGIEYDVQLSNAAGKRIKITPNLTSENAKQSQIVLWTKSSGWYSTKKITRQSSEKYWIMSVPNDQHFEFVLPGGNFGSVLFEIIK